MFRAVDRFVYYIYLYSVIFEITVHILNNAVAPQYGERSRKAVAFACPKITFWRNNHNGLYPCLRRRASASVNYMRVLNAVRSILTHILSACRYRHFAYRYAYQIVRLSAQIVVRVIRVV